MLAGAQCDPRRARPGRSFEKAGSLKTTMLVAAGLVTVGTITGAYLWSTRPQQIAPRKTTQAEMTERLRALPYARWQEVPPGDSLQQGVRLHDPARSFRGATLYTVEDESVAQLVDMDGETLHTWRNERADWHHVEMDDDGNVYVVGESALVKMDWDSRILWKVNGEFHHDLSIAPDGVVYTLIREPRYVEYRSARMPILDDVIVSLDPDGRVRDRISLWDLFHEAVGANRFQRIARLLKRGTAADSPAMQDACDVFHTNSIELLVHAIAGIAEPGDLLISLREIDTVAIVGIDSRSVLWSWGPGELVRQHHPSLLENGNILLFDNRTKEEGSRVIEFDPRTGKIEWEYKTEDPAAFWSQRRGSCQRLGNGNTLITESDRGRVFEVAPDGAVAWEFRSRVRKVNPRRIEREAIYRATRLDPSILRELPFPDSIRTRLREEGYFAAPPETARRDPDLRLPAESGRPG